MVSVLAMTGMSVVDCGFEPRSAQTKAYKIVICSPLTTQHLGDRAKTGWLRIRIQYSQRHSVINHCDRRITHLGDLNIHVSFALLNISLTYRVLLTITQKVYQNK